MEEDTEQANITAQTDFSPLENSTAAEEPIEPQVELVTPDLRRPLEPLAGNCILVFLPSGAWTQHPLALEISPSGAVVDSINKAGNW